MSEQFIQIVAAQGGDGRPFFVALTNKGRMFRCENIFAEPQHWEEIYAIVPSVPIADDEVF